MNETDARDLVQYAIWTTIVMSGPGVGVAMVVGLVIALLQALTQVQEATLTFVPKMIAVFLVSIVSTHYVGAAILEFSLYTFSMIEKR
jgi:flagellar biosynthetic protein FliQ